jgi:hypothetical protein
MMMSHTTTTPTFEMHTRLGALKHCVTLSSQQQQAELSEEQQQVELPE